MQRLMRAVTISRTLAAYLITLTLFASASAMATDCQVDSQTQASFFAAYADRGSYCEGIYEQPFSAEFRPSIVGYMIRPTTDVSGDWIKIKTNFKGLEPLSIVIQDRYRDIYYQMDYIVRNNEPSHLQWHLNVLRSDAVNLTFGDLYARGCVLPCVRSKLQLAPIEFFSSSSHDESKLSFLYIYLPPNIERFSLRLLKDGDILWEKEDVITHGQQGIRSIYLPNNIVDNGSTVQLISRSHDGAGFLAKATILPIYRP